MWAGPAYSVPSRTATRALPNHAISPKVTTSTTAVADHAAQAGIATTKASQREASSMVACTHQRSGTDRRSE